MPTNSSEEVEGGRSRSGSAAAAGMPGGPGGLGLVIGEQQLMPQQQQQLPDRLQQQLHQLPPQQQQQLPPGSAVPHGTNMNTQLQPSSPSQNPRLTLDERLKVLYPMVDERETPLPRCWSVKDKFNYIGLSHNNLRVQYKGNGKTHKEASSVRATAAIPASCGIYYFEVKIVSKGRDGYMGVGLSAQGVNMNRLPGWDKHSYGYHGDDGNSFCSSGTGQQYGPTFTTGDVIGCGLNLIDRSCFYTKNGHHLGVAFTNLPSFLYPTVGLQTPGELIDANFGQDPFVFDIEGEMKESQLRIRKKIEAFPPPGKHGDWELLLHRMVSSYLVHQGYAATAEAFASSTAVASAAGTTGPLDVGEDFASIRNRQTIGKLVMCGRMGEAIALTNRLYPLFLQKNPSLHFMLKVRQFIEMVAGCDDTEDTSNGGAGQQEGGRGTDEDTDETVSAKEETSMDVDQPSTSDPQQQQGSPAQNGNSAAVAPHHNTENGDSSRPPHPHPTGGGVGGGNYSVVNNPVRFGKLIQFGRHLQSMLQEMDKSGGVSGKLMERNRKMQQDAFALVAYPNPWESPLGWQLAPSEREQVSNALNSAILDSVKGKPGRPPLEIALIHSKQLVKLMANNDLGACAFANVEDFVN